MTKKVEPYKYKKPKFRAEQEKFNNITNFSQNKHHVKSKLKNLVKISFTFEKVKTNSKEMKFSKKMKKSLGNA